MKFDRKLPKKLKVLQRPGVRTIILFLKREKRSAILSPSQEKNSAGYSEFKQPNQSTHTFVAYLFSFELFFFPFKIITSLFKKLPTNDDITAELLGQRVV